MQATTEIPLTEAMQQGDATEFVDPTTEQLQRRERLGLFAERLDKLFQQQVADKSLVEDRWLKDLRQYNGEYEAAVLAGIREVGGSEAFLNVTRVKCNSTESRLSEMVLPTDDRNWDITPTPVPRMLLAMRNRQLARGANGQPVVGPDGKPVTVGQQLAEQQQEAKRRAELMRQYMDDQLAECQYNAVLRNVIHNMVVLGTGILKGPVIRNRMDRRFTRQPVVDPATGLPVERWQLTLRENLQPGAESVNPWDFFPDMRSRNMRECEFVFERHRFNKQQLRDLAKVPGFDPEAINELLATDPVAKWSGNVQQAASSDKAHLSTAGYEVIEYHGPIDKQDLIDAGVDVDPEDNLTTYQGTVWFCDKVVLKAVLSLLDTGELMYDVVPLERDDTMLFGFGVPYIMRNSQRAINAAWRMILDNARLSVGGQIIWKEGKVRPVNNDTRLTSLKAWVCTDPNASLADVFAVVPITANFEGMFAILEAAKQFTDEETGLPMIAQGQQSPSITKTAQGMSILMNSANTVLRRLVKEFDDAVTTRFIGRLYHWNMQFNEDEEAKGDFSIVALGSSSLLVREQQTEGLMQLSQLGGTNPEFAKRTKWGDLYRTIVKSMNINAEGLVKTDEEMSFEEEQAAAKPQQPPPEMQLEMAKLELDKADLEIKAADLRGRQGIEQARVQAEAQLAAAKTETERAKIQATVREAELRAEALMQQARADHTRILVERELALLKLAAEREMTVEQIRKEFGIAAMTIDSKHQLFNAESRLRRSTGEGI